MSPNYSYSTPNTIKNFNCLRTAALWAGGLGMVQGIIWMSLTITGIVAYKCNISQSPTLTYGSLIAYVFFDAYFRGPCRPETYQQYNKTMLESINTVLDSEDVLIWNCVYLVVAFFWLLSSVLIITHINKNNMKATLAIVYTWVVLTFCVCAMDVALGIIFGIDYDRFKTAANNYNLSTINGAAIDTTAAQLVASTVVAIALLVISFKGFVLWIINCGLLIYLLVRAVRIVCDNDGNDTLFIPRKESDDILSTRPPINAYEEQCRSTVTVGAFNNDGFVEEIRKTDVLELNQQAIARAARMSTDALLQDRRFRNLDGFQQYPPVGLNNSNIPDFANQDSVVPPITATATSIFPTPDYTPPMNRSAHPNHNGILRNQPYQL